MVTLQGTDVTATGARVAYHDGDAHSVKNRNNMLKEKGFIKQMCGVRHTTPKHTNAHKPYSEDRKDITDV